MNTTMFHTQENRGAVLSFPILCTKKNAWFGWAYYFWLDKDDAVNWGVTSKGGNYRIYSARIDAENVLDTVYNEEHYKFFYGCIEQVRRAVEGATGCKLSVQDICEYLNKKAKWKDHVDVLLAADMPRGPRELAIPLRKRIQAAVYNKDCIHDFKEAE